MSSPDPRNMAPSCILCERLSENAQQNTTYHIFPENQERRKKWLDAIGKTEAEVPAGSSLCSRHFSRDCFVDTIMKNDAVPILRRELGDTSKENEEDPSAPREQKLCNSRYTSPIVRPIIRRRRIHMLSDEEMREQPIKYVRHLKSVNWDETSKTPDEAKIVWEVAMEELKEGNDKLKLLKANVRQLKKIIRGLKAALKTRTRRAAAAVVAARRHQVLD